MSTPNDPTMSAEFVRYAREHDLGLDFTTPPKRPDPKESLERMIQALDRSEAER